MINKDYLIKEKKLASTLLKELWPFHRSITGEGIRKSLNTIGKYMPLKKTEIASGKKVHDWKIPQEWVVNDAYLLDPKGKKIIDVKKNNLHLLNYSDRYIGFVDKKNLENHLFSNPKIPNAIPYVTSYYEKRWGFCISHNQRKKLIPGKYKVFIDTKLINGSLTFGEAYLPGSSKKEILISTYICHPSMANDQLSGPISTLLLYRRLARMLKRERRYSFRFLFLPETIGSIAYLSLHGKSLKKKLVGGLVYVLTGGAGPISYRRSRKKHSLIDRAAIKILTEWKETNKNSKKPEINDFNPAFGNDQRQYCSPQYDFPIGCLTNTSSLKTKEYHSSLDNIKNFSITNLLNNLDVCMSIIEILLNNKTFKNLKGYGEPFLTKYNLYPTLNKGINKVINDDLRAALLWVLNYSDGKNDLLTISEISKIRFSNIYAAAKKAKLNNLLK